jgi:hypothetical protein
MKIVIIQDEDGEYLGISELWGGVRLKSDLTSVAVSERDGAILIRVKLKDESWGPWFKVDPTVSHGGLWGDGNLRVE